MTARRSQVLAFGGAKVMARATGKPITRQIRVVSPAMPTDLTKIFR